MYVTVAHSTAPLFKFVMHITNRKKNSKIILSLVLVLLLVELPRIHAATNYGLLYIDYDLSPTQNLHIIATVPSIAGSPPTASINAFGSETTSASRINTTTCIHNGTEY